MWRIDGEQLKCKAGETWPNDDQNKFDADALKESVPNVAIQILNTVVPLKEIRALGDPKKPMVGKKVQILEPFANPDESKQRNMWIVTKHHVEKEDWFTLKSEATGYYLTCPTKGEENEKQPIVSYEVPGIHITCYWLSVKVHTMKRQLFFLFFEIESPIYIVTIE